MMTADMEQPLVSICCITYNHAEYIRQCLDGFLMQNTSFSYEIIINDDCSTDGTTDVIREYEERYPTQIEPIYHVENEYSKGVRGMFVTYCFPKAKGKYIAMCEGDDFWIDPLKLQKQVDFMETNPDYSMCCSDAIIFTNERTLDWCRYNRSQQVPVKDIILGGGLFVQTASLLFKRTLIKAEDYPEEARKCHVGDYPLQLFAALKGKVYWFAEKQVAYRYQSANSWTRRNLQFSFDKQLKDWQSELAMLDSMDLLSSNIYTQYFTRRKIDFIYIKFLLYPKQHSLLKEYFCDITSLFSLKQRIVCFFVRTRLFKILRVLKSKIRKNV